MSFMLDNVLSSNLTEYTFNINKLGFIWKPYKKVIREKSKVYLLMLYLYTGKLLCILYLICRYTFQQPTLNKLV